MGNWLVHHELEGQAHWRSDSPAIRFEGTVYAYGAYDSRVNRLARALAEAGIGDGDRILVHGHNHADLYTVFFACSKLGAVFSPVSVYQSAQNVQFICDALDPAFVFYTNNADIREETLPTLRAAAGTAAFVSLDDTSVGDDDTLAALVEGRHDGPPVGSDDHAAADTHNIFWTSGTTGRPKGVVRDHAATLRFADVLLGAFPFAPDNVRLTTNDMMFAAPYLQYGLPTVMSGAENVILRRFSPESVYDTYREHDITVTMLVFTQGSILLDYLDDEGLDLSLRALHAVVPSAKRAGRLADLTDELYHIYATTETGVVATKRLEAPFGDPPAVGTPGRGVDTRVVPVGESDRKRTAVRPGDTGELLVRGDVTMARYFEDDHQQELVVDGWIHTGDSVEVNDDDELVFRGRIDDRIRSGGINIYPSEIESVLVGHPAVETAVVVGVADERWGQRVCALIHASVEDTDVLEAELDARCRDSEGLTSEMRPRTYAFVGSADRIPTGAVNKIRRSEVVEQFFAP